jgi:hypothetical protein
MRQRPMDEEVAAEKPAAKSDGTDPWDAKPKVAGGAG